MAAIELKIRPALGSGYTSGGFVAFGLGADVDEALDFAATSDRLAVGDSGLIPSAAGIDPAAPRLETADPVHPLYALTRALDALGSMEPGVVAAQAVQPLGDFRHRRVRVLLDDPTLILPDDAGIIEHPDPLALAAASVAVAATDTPVSADELVVQLELTRPPKRRFKAAAEPVRGPMSKTWAVYAVGDPTPLVVLPSQSEARRWAMARARDKEAGAMSLEVRPVVGRNDGEAFIRIERRCVSLKAPLKVTIAEPKDRVRVNGWIFYGRLGG